MQFYNLLNMSNFTFPNFDFNFGSWNVLNFRSTFMPVFGWGAPFLSSFGYGTPFMWNNNYNFWNNTSSTYVGDTFSSKTPNTQSKLVDIPVITIPKVEKQSPQLFEKPLKIEYTPSTYLAPEPVVESKAEEKPQPVFKFTPKPEAEEKPQPVSEANTKSNAEKKEQPTDKSNSEQLIKKAPKSETEDNKAQISVSKSDENLNKKSSIKFTPVSTISRSPNSVITTPSLINYRNLTREEALNAAKNDPSLERLVTTVSKNGHKVIISEASFVNDIPYAKKGTMDVLLAAADKIGRDLTITSALGCKTSPHSGTFTGNSHYNPTNPKIDFGGGLSPDEASRLEAELESTGLFNFVTREIDGKTAHLDAQIALSSYEAYA